VAARLAFHRSALAWPASGFRLILLWGADCEIRINPSVCPAQMTDPGPSVNAAGVVDTGLSQWRKCAAARVILFAASQLGKPYAWGATGPDAFDCSGLAMMAYRSADIAIPRTSQEQWTAGTYVPPGQEEPGDLVFFADSDGTTQRKFSDER
jgi:cell wall-associated NlpC family hydrolase